MVLKGEGLAYNIIPSLSITVDCCWRCSQPQRTSAQRSMSGGSVKYGAVSVLHLASLRHWCVSLSDKWRGISVAAGTVGPAGCFKISAGLACQAVPACICPRVPPPPQHGPSRGGAGAHFRAEPSGICPRSPFDDCWVGGDHLTGLEGTGGHIETEGVIMFTKSHNHATFAVGERSGLSRVLAASRPAPRQQALGPSIRPMAFRPGIPMEQ